MNVNDKRYDNQGIHTVLALFTVDDGKFKVLLIRRKNEPYKGKWILVGGCAYNDEFAEEAMIRELYEKTRIKNVDFEMFGVFSDPKRSPLKRMLAIGYMGVADRNIIEKFSQTKKVSEADWFSIDRIPELGYDHREILEQAITCLKQKIFTTNIIKKIFPKTFTLPELQQAYETIMEKSLDRRNFRKKLLKDGIIVETNEVIKKEKTKTCKLYMFSDKNTDINFYK